MDELSTLKQRQARVWAEGDYRPVGRMLAAGAESLVEAAGVAAGTRVLDVGVGSGSVGIAAARRGATVVGVDITDAWFGEARRRAKQHAVSLELRIGDAEDLADPDDAYDMVLSSFAMVFAPRHAQVAAEVVRVCRPGGTIAYTAWDDSLATTTLAQFLPPGPAFAGDPMRWADPRYVEDLFFDLPVAWTFARRALPVTFPSVNALEDFVFTNSGPMMAARAALLEAGAWEQAKTALREAFVAENTATDGSYAADWRYLLGMARKDSGA